MRSSGDKNSVLIPISELAAKLADMPNFKVAVTKGWLKMVEQNVGIFFENNESETPTPIEMVPATLDSKQRFEIA